MTYGLYLNTKMDANSLRTISNFMQKWNTAIRLLARLHTIKWTGDRISC